MKICKLDIVRIANECCGKMRYVFTNKGYEDIIEKTNKHIIVKIKKDIFLNEHFYEVITGIEIPTLFISYENSMDLEYEKFKITGFRDFAQFYGIVYSQYSERNMDKICWGKESVMWTEIDKYLKEHADIPKWYDELMSYFYPNNTSKKEIVMTKKEGKEQIKSLAKTLVKTNKY